MVNITSNSIDGLCDHDQLDCGAIITVFNRIKDKKINFMTKKRTKLIKNNNNISFSKIFVQKFIF